MFRSCKLDNNIKIEDNDASEGDRVDDVGADTQILEDVNDGHNIDCEYDDDDAATDDDDDDSDVVIGTSELDSYMCNHNVSNFSNFRALQTYVTFK